MSRTSAGLALAIVTAPCGRHSVSPPRSWATRREGPADTIRNRIGGTPTFLLVATLFGSVLALVP